MTDIIVALLVVAAPLVVVALGVFEILFRRDEVGQSWRRLVETERRLREGMNQTREAIRSARNRAESLARSYEDGYIHRVLRRRPIRDLRQYISVSMSWSALEEAGITNLAKFMSFRGDFERLHGIGDARSRGLREARRKLSAELGETTLPMPTLRPPGTLEFDVISSVLRASELQCDAGPELERLDDEFQKLQRQRPGPLGVRWHYWFGDRDELCRRIEASLEELEPLAEDEMPALTRIVEEAGASSGDVERLNDRYEAHQENIKAMLDDSTRRPVRGALRPVGAAAMRAAEGFDDEEDFCDRALEPLIAKLGYNHRREHTIKRRIGSREKAMYVDFLLLDDADRPVAVLEAKRNIRTDNQLDGASKQGLSYALFEQLDPVMVAAPQGLWLYERQNQQLELHDRFDIEEAYERIDELRERIEELADRRQRRRRAGAY